MEKQFEELFDAVQNLKIAARDQNSKLQWCINVLSLISVSDGVPDNIKEYLKNNIDKYK